MGVQEIDDEHRELFRLAAGLHEAIEGEVLDLASSLVDQFLEAAKRHFNSEEAYLVRVGYSGVGAHHVLHQSLLTKAKALKIVCDDEFERGRFENCFDEIVNLLVDDIVRADNQFRSYLDHHGYSSRRAGA
jgi:hemerythrin